MFNVSLQVTDLVYSQDGSQLFSISDIGTLKSWDATTGEYLYRADVKNFKSSPHSKLFTTGTGRLILEDYNPVSSPLRIFAAASGTLLHEAKYARENDVSKYEPGIMHNTVVGCKNALRKGQLIDVLNGQVKKKDLLSNLKQFVMVAMTHSERHLLVGYSDVTDMIDTQNQEVVRKFANRTVASHSDIISPSQMAITQDDRILITGFSVDCLVTMINIDLSSDQFGQILYEFDYQRSFPSEQFFESSQYSQEVCELKISPNQELALANVKGSHLFVLDLANGNSSTIKVEMTNGAIMLNTQMFEGSGMIFHESCFLQDNNSVAAIYGNNLCMWSVETGELLSHLRLHGSEEENYVLVASPTHNHVATVSECDAAIKVHNTIKWTLFSSSSYLGGG